MKKNIYIYVRERTTVSVADVGIVECGRCVGAKGNRIMKYLCEFPDVVGRVKHQHRCHCLDLQCMCFLSLMIITVGGCKFKLYRRERLNTYQLHSLGI